MAAMTEHPKEPAPDDTSPAPPPTDTPSSEPTSRWDRVRPRGRLGQIATILVAAAAAVFIVGSIFVAGYVLGSEGGDEHDGHRGEGYSHSQGEQRGDARSQTSPVMLAGVRMSPITRTTPSSAATPTTVTAPGAMAKPATSPARSSPPQVSNLVMCIAKISGAVNTWLGRAQR